MMSEHTRGPWTGQPGFTVPARNGAWYQTIVGFPPDTCVARAIGSTREECDANARLITAALDLLEACQAVQQWGLKGQMPDGRWAFDLLAPAIAKATTWAMPTS